MNNDQPVDDSPLLHVTIKDASEIASISHGKKGVKVAVIGAGFDGHIHALVRAIHTKHPEIGVIVMEKAPPSGTLLSMDELPPKMEPVKFELRAMEPMAEVYIAKDNSSKPWRTRHKNNYKSKRRRSR